MRALAAAFLFAVLCFATIAQENPAPPPQEPAPALADTQVPLPAPAESSSIHPEWLLERYSLPDAPRPQLNDDRERTPCPEGEFKPCALIGGKPFLRDRSRMTQHDKSAWQGFKHPMILAGSALLVATTVYDIEGTQSCLHAGTCRETNFLYGPRPGRARLLHRHAAQRPFDLSISAAKT